MNHKAAILCAALFAAGCGTPASPSGNTREWENYEWFQITNLPVNVFSVLYSVNGDSLYMMVKQVADTTGCRMPDLVSFDVYTKGSFEQDYHRDGNRALMVSGAPETDDWYEYFYPYGLGDGTTAESIPFQPDTALGRSNDVHAVFFGEVAGDSVLVFRKAFCTGDPQCDATLVHDSTYEVGVLLQWGEPGDSLFFFTQSSPMPVHLP